MWLMADIPGEAREIASDYVPNDRVDKASIEYFAGVYRREVAKRQKEMLEKVKSRPLAEVLAQEPEITQIWGTNQFACDKCEITRHQITGGSEEIVALMPQGNM